MATPIKKKPTDPLRFRGPVNGATPEEQHARTLKRLESLRNQLATRPLGNRLKGKVCIITGAGSLKGIGRASAFAYAHEGAAHLYLLDFDGRNLPELQKTLTESYPETEVTVVQGDAADEPTISNLCQKAIEDKGRLDVFFANAGIVKANLLESTTSEEFMTMMRVNVLSCFLAIKHGSKAMLKTSAGKEGSGGSIVLTASVAGIRAGAGPMDYSASKASVNSLAKTSAYQLVGTDIRVNTICPGLIETGMTEMTFEIAKKRGTSHKFGHLIPAQRSGVAEEIAQTAVFLACDDSSYVNGQNIAVDGGLSASHPYVAGKIA